MNNPPAFPCTTLIDGEPIISDRQIVHPGMPLRDYFAGKAIQGILAAECEGSEYVATYVDPDGKETYRSCSPAKTSTGADHTKPAVEHVVLRTIEQNQARAAYKIADAMLKAREEKP